MVFVTFKVDDNTKLGEWVGLCKIDKEGRPRMQGSKISQLCGDKGNGCHYLCGSLMMIHEFPLLISKNSSRITVF